MSTATRPTVTLPARAYTDPAIFERERREVFARSWIPVCSTAQVAEPGQYVASSIGGEPVIVIRGEDGELRALSNVCRHRASLLVRAAGACPRVLRCPYHGWTYGHDGKLVGVPEARGFEDLDRDRVALPSFQIGVLAGLVCVNLDRDAPPLEGWFGDLADRVAALGIGNLRAEGPFVTEYPHNWKVVADNYLEGYHIPVGHPGLLRLLDYKRYTPTPGRNHSWIAAPLREGTRSKERLERLYQRAYEPMPGFPDELAGSWTYAHLFPATFLDIYPDQIDTWQLQPLGVRRTRTISWIFVPEGGTARAAAARKANQEINELVMDEDVFLCDGVQEGLESLTYERGVLNRNEAAVGHFHDLLRAAMPGIDEG
jgi:Rieske 2Fe-2S family protein